MTDEVTTAAGNTGLAAAPVTDPNLAKAIEHGYVPDPPPSREERVAALVSGVEHAMANNAPMTQDMLAELKALLAV